MRVMFFGASELGYKCCQAVIESGHEVVAIITIPQKFSIKYKGDSERKKVTNVLFADFSNFKTLHNIDVIAVEGNLSEKFELIKEYDPELILVVGWYYNIPEKILSIPRLGSLGIHGSLLPKYRGNAPFVWAMINGEKETGVSLFYFDDGIDTGNIAAQISIPIEKTDTIKHILEKAEVASVKILKETLPLLADGQLIPRKQNHEEATSFAKRTPADGLIDWNLSIQQINDFIRAQTKPYPGAFTIINNKKVIIWDACIEEMNDDLDLTTS